MPGGGGGCSQLIAMCLCGEGGYQLVVMKRVILIMGKFGWVIFFIVARDWVRQWAACVRQ